jgi:hypothetical protein
MFVATLVLALCYLVSVAIGAAAGSRRGRTLAGLFWTVLLGPVGLILVAFLKARAGSPVLALGPVKRVVPSPAKAIPLAGPVLEGNLRVARGSEDLGSMTVAEVRRRLAAGELTLQDYFFDFEARSWVALASCPDVL